MIMDRELIRTTEENTLMRKELLSVAKDLNEVFGLEPPIDTSLKEAALFELVSAAAKDAVPVDENDLKTATWTFLNDHEMINHLLKPRKKAASTATKKPAKKAEAKPAAKPTNTQKQPRKCKTEWMGSGKIQSARPGTKVDKAIEFMKGSATADILFADLMVELDWPKSLAKAYLTDNIVKLGYTVRISEDGTSFTLTTETSL